MAHPWPTFENGFEHDWRSVAVLNVSAVNNKTDQEPAGVGDDVALAAFDLLSGVKAPYSAAFRGFYALAVDHACRRAGFAPGLFARRHHQSVVHRPPKTAVPPQIEIVLNRREGREVLRQLPPLAAGGGDIRKRIENLPHIRLARTPKIALRRDSGFKKPIACHSNRLRIALSAAHIACG